MKKTRNQFEQKVYRVLRRNKLDFKYEGERIPYVIASHYIPDFVINTRLGKIYVETKGYLRPEDKRKLAAIKRQHPEIDLRIIFYSDNKKYIKWAEKIGIRWSIGTIPKEWIQGL